MKARQYNVQNEKDKKNNIRQSTTQKTKNTEQQEPHLNPGRCSGRVRSGEVLGKGK
jgi:hypothetical protein